jgi:membrane-bound serine protease (ClpP class)
MFLSKITLWLMLCFSNALFANVAIELTIKGGIGPATADYIARNIEKAQSKANFVLITIDTPGGLGKSTRQIVKAMLASKIPVIAYVTPRGARAASAGTFILYASTIAVMAPGTHLGAASPVSLAGGLTGTKNKKKSTMTKKVTNDAVAYIRTLAQLNKRDVGFAESAVVDAATLTAKEALDKNVINFIAKDKQALIRALNGYKLTFDGKIHVLNTDNLQLKLVKPDWRARFLFVITSPTVAYLLLLLGIYGIFFELVNPGFVLPGVVGAIAIMVAMYALHMLPINYAGLGLILLGIIFMVAEGFIPSFGALGIGGVIAFILGSLLLIDTEHEGYRIATSVVWAMAAANALFFFVIMNMAITVRRQSKEHGLESMVGKKGVSITTIDVAGQVKIKGEIWQAQSATFIACDKAVKVVKVHGLYLDVVEA